MKLENANLSPPNTTNGSVVKQAPALGSGTSSDDVHLSELVRSLRSLVPDSPERQERLEQIARSYASGTYTVNLEATASGIIDDAMRYPAGPQ